MIKEVIQIVPTLPPAVSGVGDYAVLLAKELWKQYGIKTLFIVGGSEWDSESRLGEFVLGVATARTKETLVELLSYYTNHPLLLHYVGYGYAKRGAPFWLVEGIRRGIENRKRNFSIMFHEVYASGPIWKSAFWYSFLQKIVVRELLILASRYYTSTSHYALKIKELLPTNEERKSLEVIPVCSNVGELNDISDYYDRSPQAVVFGGEVRRRSVYKYWSDFEKICKDINIKTIVDIGPCRPEYSGSLPIKRYGVLRAEQISQLLRESQIGLIVLPQYLLEKSGVFAAYCSHGLAPVVREPDCFSNYELQIPYIGVIEKGLRTHELREIMKVAEMANTWYQSHTLAILAEEVSKGIMSS